MGTETTRPNTERLKAYYKWFRDDSQIEIGEGAQGLSDAAQAGWYAACEYLERRGENAIYLISIALPFLERLLAIAIMPTQGQIVRGTTEDSPLELLIRRIKNENLSSQSEIAFEDAATKAEDAVSCAMPHIAALEIAASGATDAFEEFNEAYREMKLLRAGIIEDEEVKCPRCGFKPCHRRPGEGYDMYCSECRHTWASPENDRG